MIPKLNQGMELYYEHLTRYLFALQFVKDKIVLDAGCGVGYGSFLLSKYGQAKKVIGIDNSQDAIEYAKDKYKLKNISYLVDDVESLTSLKDKTFDTIIGFEIIEHLENQKNFLFQIKRLLKDDGVFLVSSPNKATYPQGHNPFHIKEFYPKEFLQFLKKFFPYVMLYFQTNNFSNIIGKESSGSLDVLNIVKREQDFYLENLEGANSQYIIAICAAPPLKEPKMVSVNTPKIEGFDLTEGLAPYWRLKKESAELNSIKSTKFYKIWRSYLKIKGIFLNSNKK